MVKPTSWKWCVQPVQICKWRQQMQQDKEGPNSLPSLYWRELGVVESIKTVGKNCLHWVKCTLATGRMDGWAGIQGMGAMSSATLCGSPGQQSVLNNFSVHMQHNNVSALQQLGVEVDFFPAGYTPVLKAMDKRVAQTLWTIPEGGEPGLHGSTSQWCQTYTTTYLSVDCKSLGASPTHYHSKYMAIHWYSSIS
jgi:hypothetical protein